MGLGQWVTTEGWHQRPRGSQEGTFSAGRSWGRILYSAPRERPRGWLSSPENLRWPQHWAPCCGQTNRDSQGSEVPTNPRMFSEGFREEATPGLLEEE